ncbi:hypothetical protein IVB15_26500 [Bradyrhizobium sp. 182]|uniref:hypothetical protein n=1 Tax=Bradyrhizobium sp. 182 TaxID=2782651 RepID=UPI001FF7802C|nr:hypothetical protein [Bradyrhizobium sp. 182]MCK1531161.1 hypothetical protein [Bradyrhizobium sp. 182]
MAINIPACWLAAFENAKLGPRKELENAIRRYASVGTPARLGALMAVAYRLAGTRPCIIPKIEQALNSNASALYFVAQGLAEAGLMVVDKDPKRTEVRFTPKGLSLAERCQ